MKAAILKSTFLILLGLSVQDCAKFDNVASGDDVSPNQASWSLAGQTLLSSGANSAALVTCDPVKCSAGQVTIDPSKFDQLNNLYIRVGSISGNVDMSWLKVSLAN